MDFLFSEFVTWMLLLAAVGISEGGRWWRKALSAPVFLLAAIAAISTLSLFVGDITEDDGPTPYCDDCPRWGNPGG